MAFVRNTAREQSAQIQIQKFMQQQGYPTFARLFGLYTLILTTDPGCIGYTTPDGVICLNEGLTMEGFSFVCRHEILHNWLNHHERMIKHAAKKLGFDPNNLTLEQTQQATQNVYGDPRRLDNYASDWEMSQHYTREDKNLAKHLECSGRMCEGLVLEMDRPDLLGMTAEQIWDKLLEEDANNPPPPPPENPEDGEDEENNDGGGNGGGYSGQYGKKSGKGGAGGDEDEDGDEDEGGDEGTGSKPGGQGQKPGGQGQNGQGNQPGGQGGQGNSGKSGSETDEPGGNYRAGHNAPGSNPEAPSGKAQARGVEQNNEEGEKVMIGDHGSKSWQEQEAERRAKQVEKDVAKGRIEDKSDEELQKEFDERARKINDTISNSGSKDQAEMEINSKKRKEKEQQDRSQKRITGATYSMHTFNEFKQAVRRFCKDVRDEADDRARSWSRIDRKNQNPQIMKQGTKNTPSGNVPYVNVYMDMSQSCKPYRSTVEGVGKMFEKLQAEQLCKYHKYYFANTLTEYPVDGGNGWGGADLAQHVYDTGAKNIVVVTDSDTNGLPEAINKVKIDHAWFICVNSEKPNGMIRSVTGAPGRIQLYSIGQSDKISEG